MERNPLANADLCEVLGDSFSASPSERLEHPCTLQFALLGETADIDEATTSLCNRCHLLEVLLHGVGDGGLALGKEQISLHLGSLDASFAAHCCPLESVSFSDIDPSSAARRDSNVVSELDRYTDLAARIWH